MGPGNGIISDNVDDDLIEIKDTRLSSLKEEPKAVHRSLQHITPERSREQSTASSGLRQPSSKRPASQVIDLTGSDEEETPYRPPKRPSYNHPSRLAVQNGFRELTSVRNASTVTLGGSSQSSSDSPAPPSYYYDA